MLINGSLTPGELTAFVLYLTFFFAPIQQMVQLYNGYQQGQASAKKLRELLENEPSVAEAPDAVDLPPIEGEITFDRVSFGYDDDTPVLHEVSLRLAPGESLAVVGAHRGGQIHGGQADHSVSTTPSRERCASTATTCER